MLLFGREKLLYSAFEGCISTFVALTCIYTQSTSLLHGCKILFTQNSFSTLTHKTVTLRTIADPQYQLCYVSSKYCLYSTNGKLRCVQYFGIICHAILIPHCAQNTVASKTNLHYVSISKYGSFHLLLDLSDVLQYLARKPLFEQISVCFGQPKIGTRLISVGNMYPNVDEWVSNSSKDYWQK